MTKTVMKIHRNHILFSIENALHSQTDNLLLLITRKKTIQQNQAVTGNKVITESERNSVRRNQTSKCLYDMKIKGVYYAEFSFCRECAF